MIGKAPLRSGLLPALLLCGSAFAASIVVQPGDTLRSLAERHVGDADLWEELLRANDLQSAADVHPGMQLELPPQTVIDAQRRISEAQRKIQEANHLHARLFAVADVTRAVSLWDRALDERRRRNWSQALALATRSAEAADEAIEICKRLRNVATEAKLIDKRGRVERRQPGAVVWKDAKLKAMLNERDKLRTLSASSAEILFRDESRLRMDENSQLVIKRMRANRLEHRQQAKVSLIAGDIFAVLGGNQRRDKFDVEIPEVQLAGDSRDFFVQRQGEKTRLANYEGQLQVVSKETQVTLDENEGVGVQKGALTEKRQLLPPPRNLVPTDATLVYAPQVELSWDPVDGAVSYWLEVSDNAAFKGIVAQTRDLAEPRDKIDGLPEGNYFWRVSAMDADGFPGTRNKGNSFRIAHDREPPLLVLYEPAQGETLHRTPAVVTGIVEIGSTLTLDEEAVTPDAEGDFRAEHPLREGENRFRLAAVDAAGNRTELERTVLYEPEPALFLTFDPGLPMAGSGDFAALGDSFNLLARTLPWSHLRVTTTEGAPILQADADETGALSLVLPLAGEMQRYRLQLRSPGGATIEKEIGARRRAEPPQLRLEPEPPGYTAADTLVLRGEALGATNLKINGEPVAIQSGEFEKRIPLQEGENQLTFQLQDEVGNIRTLQRLVQLDQTAPRVGDRSLTRTRGGQGVAISVAVQDASPLHRSAPFELVAGEFRHKGLLRLNGNGDRLRGEVVLPPGNHHEARLSRLVVEDQLGNRIELSD